MMKRIVFIAIGSISLGLGILGVFLPVLPTTPFLLLSAWLYARSSARLHHWLLNHKYFGTYIKDFIEDKAISLPAKIISLLMMWATIICTIFIAVRGKLILQILLAIIAFAVSGYILSFKTKRSNE